MNSEAFGVSTGRPRRKPINTSKTYLISGRKMAIEMTRLSERGQVVIPTGVRKSMHLKEGERFIVMGLGDTIVLRKLELSQERLRLKKLMTEARARAKKSGFTAEEVKELIHATRKIRA